MNPSVVPALDIGFSAVADAPDLEEMVPSPR